MSETVLNAAGTSAAGTVASVQPKTMNLKYFGWLYMFFGACVLIIGDLFLEYPGAYKGVYTPAKSLDTTSVAILSVIGILIAILGFLDYRSVKSNSNKTYFAAIIFILGIALIPLYSYYGAFTGLLGNNYDLSGISMGGFLMVFAALGEIYLLRKQKSTHT